MWALGVGFFMENVAGQNAEQLRFLAISAQAVRYEPDLLKGIIRFRKLERFTLYYSSTDVDARRQWADDYKHNLTLKLTETLGQMEREDEQWKCPSWSVEYLLSDGEVIAARRIGGN